MKPKLLLLLLSSIFICLAGIASAAPVFPLRHVAPAATSVVVEAAWEEEPIVLTRGEKGVWTAKASEIKPGTHEFRYVTVPPTDGLPVGILNVPAEGDGQFHAGIPRGTVQAFRYPCAALGVERECWIYRPPGHDESDRDFPFLVLQHAGADTHKTWVSKGKVDWLLDSLIASGKAKPMVVLMIDGHPEGEKVYFKADTRERAMIELERELIKNAIPVVEKHCRIAKDRELRGLAGPSVGGGQVISIGFRQLDRFAWIGVFSMGRAIPSFYEPALADAGMVNDKLKLLWIACATEDYEFKNNEKFIAMLNEKGIRHQWHPTAGAHTWPVWRRDLGDFLTNVFQVNKP